MTGLASIVLASDPAKEGGKVVLAMLATGGVFVGVIALGQLLHWIGSKRNGH